MITKKNRTLEGYLKAGAEMRLFKDLNTKLLMDISPMLKVDDIDRLIKAMDKVNRVCSRAEDNMFADFPELSNDYLTVFYGNLKGESRNEVDADQVKRARQVVDELFE